VDSSEWADGTSHLLFEPLELLGLFMLPTLKNALDNIMCLPYPLPISRACEDLSLAVSRPPHRTAVFISSAGFPGAKRVTT